MKRLSSKHVRLFKVFIWIFIPFMTIAFLLISTKLFTEKIFLGTTLFGIILPAIWIYQIYDLRRLLDDASYDEKSLLTKKGHITENIPLADIENVEYSSARICHICITLNSEHSSGKNFYIMVPAPNNPFARFSKKHPDVEGFLEAFENYSSSVLTN